MNSKIKKLKNFSITLLLLSTEEEMNTKITVAFIDEVAIADIERRLQKVNDDLSSHRFQLFLRAVSRGDDVKENLDDKLTEYYKKSIESMKIEKIIYLTLKTGNAGLFNKLYQRYNDVSVELIELSSELVSIGIFSEGNHLEFSNNMMSQMDYIKIICNRGTNGLRAVA